MRVALDATYSVDAQPSGIGVYSRRILDGLAQAYCTDEFLHCYRPKQFRRAEPAKAPNVKRCMLLPVRLPLGADVFHALNQRVDRRYAKRVVSTFHDLFVMTSEYSSLDFRQRFTKQAREASKRSDLIITVSQFTANQVHDLLGVERARLRVIPHGVDSVPHSDEIPREPLVLFVGALQVRKNVGRLVKAFEAMRESWRLVLVGATTGYGAEEILTQIEQSAARQRIEVAGYVAPNRLLDLFAKASIFAFPSLDEGFGIPVIEAMARGVPVITSNTSALAEVAGDAALLVDPLDGTEIAGALEQLAEQPSLRATLAAKGKARAAQFTWENAVRKTYGVYKELTSV